MICDMALFQPRKATPRRVEEALIAHALATQMSDATISLPQPSNGVNITMRGSYPG
ncbi:MAG: hypothetical protein QOI01_5408 [Mycobacterium sp.]|nr:hypothetical protein [Mycobacterium sp.]